MRCALSWVRGTRAAPERFGGTLRRFFRARLHAAETSAPSAVVADLDGQQHKLRELLADARSSLDRAQQAGVQISRATTQTIATAETAANHTLRLAFWLSLALLACLLIGVPISAVLYRRFRKSEPDHTLAHA